MAEVVVNIKANTGQATDGVDDLNNSLNQTEQSSEALSASLAKQEARIKTLDGAINLIGGSVEILAGGLALSGALTQEQAEQFETAAIGAIAFADGTKRVLDGYKSLNEGLAAYGGIAGKAKLITQSLNKAVLANPYVAAAVAITALVAGIAVYIQSTKNEKGAIEDLNVVSQRRLDIAKETARVYFNAEQTLAQLTAAAKSNNTTIAEEAKLRKDNAEQAIREANNTLNSINFKEREGIITAELAATERERFTISRDEAKKYYDQIVAAETLYTTNVQTENEKRLEAEKKAADERNGNRAKEYETALKDYKTFQADIDKANKEAVELFIEGLGGLTQKQGAVLKQLPMQTAQATTEVTADLQDYYLKTFNDLTEFYESSNAQAISATLNTAATFSKTLADVQDDSTKEGFEASKKYKIAEVVTSSIQAAFQAFGAAQQFGPILGPILGAAQVAAIAIASNKAIQDIRSSSFNSTSAPAGGGTPSVSIPNINTGPQGGGQFLPNTAPQATPPVRAYVVTGDVTSGQVAEQQLQTRRRFG